MKIIISLFLTKGVKKRFGRKKENRRKKVIIIEEKLVVAFLFVITRGLMPNLAVAGFGAPFVKAVKFAAGVCR